MKNKFGSKVFEFELQNRFILKEKAKPLSSLLRPAQPVLPRPLSLRLGRSPAPLPLSLLFLGLVSHQACPPPAPLPPWAKAQQGSLQPVPEPLPGGAHPSEPPPTSCFSPPPSSAPARTEPDRATEQAADRAPPLLPDPDARAAHHQILPSSLPPQLGQVRTRRHGRHVPELASFVTRPLLPSFPL